MSADSQLKLIVGLGNPGGKYSETRHNAGFWFVDALARQCGACFRAESKFHGDVARGVLAGRDVWLLKPATFMNRSGQAVQAMLHFYRLAPSQLLVAHDEIDLPVAAVKLKTGGGHGGHNGLRDIIAQCGSAAFHRLRIGVGHPGDRNQVVDYVLHRPALEERIAIDQGIDAALEVMPAVIAGDMQKAMQQLHSK